MKRRPNPLGRIKIEGVKTIADEVVAHISSGGRVVIDLSDPDDRLILRDSISHALNRYLDSAIFQPLEVACAKAIGYVLEVAKDDVYQEERTKARDKSIERRKAKEPTREAKLMARKLTGPVM